MLISYLIMPSLLGILLSLVWTSKDWINTIFKGFFIGWTLWSLMLLAGAVWPTINNGSIRLI